MVTLQDFIHRLKSKNHLVQYNKQHHRKVLLSSFHLNGHTSGFYPQTQKLITKAQSFWEAGNDEGGENRRKDTLFGGRREN